MKIILFACVHNAGRSQMAAGFFNFLTNPTQARAISAGTQPASTINPIVLEAMNEVGINLSQATPQFLSDDLAKQASMLITMGCGEACPHIPGLQRDDWPLTDPKGKTLDEVRKIREEIKERVVNLIKTFPTLGSFTNK